MIVKPEDARTGRAAEHGRRSRR